MRLLRRLALGVAAVVAVGGCAGVPPSNGPGAAEPAGAEPAEAAEPAAEPGSLVGRTFLSESVTEDGEPRPPVEGTRIEIAFSAGGRLRATAGCNVLSGAVVVRPDRLVVGELSSTRMACASERHEQDRWLAGVLAADPDHVLRGTRLLLTSGGSEIRLVDRAASHPDHPLAGTDWRLESLLDGDTVAPLPPGTGATLVFADDSLALEVVDCNRGTGDVAVSGATIEVGPLAMSARACPPDPSAVEHAVVTVLHGAIGYVIAGDTLTLRHPSGRGLVLRAPAAVN